MEIGGGVQYYYSPLQTFEMEKIEFITSFTIYDIEYYDSFLNFQFQAYLLILLFF